MARGVHAVMQDAEDYDFVGPNFEEEHMAAAATIARHVSLTKTITNVAARLGGVGVARQLSNRRQKCCLVDARLA